MSSSSRANPGPDASGSLLPATPGEVNAPAAGVAPPPRLLDQLRQAIRVRHYSIRTEVTYADWVRRFILFHDKRHPKELGAPEVAAFLTHLAVDRSVSPSTQNQAKSALLFLYRSVLDVHLPWLDEVVAAKDRPRLPVVLTPSEVRSLLHALNGTMGLVASLLYGTGMRLLEGFAPANRRRRLRTPGDPGAQRQGRQGPRDGPAGEPDPAAARSDRQGAGAARKRSLRRAGSGPPA